MTSAKPLAPSGNAVVLLYHRMGMPRRSSIVGGQYVPPALFRSGLKLLAGRGWSFAPLGALLEARQREDSRQRQIGITFDDGYLSVYEYACPVLLDAEIPATVYVVAGSVGGVNAWDVAAGDRVEPVMTARQLRELAEQGIEIGSHSLTHPHLTRLPDDQLIQELTVSKQVLEDIIGKEVTSFSYPYGDYDQRVLDAVSAAGYASAACTRLGAVACRTSPLEVPRVNIRWGTFGPFLLRKIERARRESVPAANGKAECG